MTEPDLTWMLWAALAANMGCGVWCWWIARKLNRELRTATAYRMLLVTIARKQFYAAAMASHGWRAWSGTMGAIRVQFGVVEEEDEADG